MFAWPSQSISTHFGKSCIPDPFSTLFSHLEVLCKTILDFVDSGYPILSKVAVTNFIQPYLHQFFDDSHGLKASLKPLRRPFNQYQSCLEAINNGRDIRQINW